MVLCYRFGQIAWPVDAWTWRYASHIQMQFWWVEKKMFGSGHEKLQKFSWQQRCGRQKWLTMDRAQFHVRNKRASFIHFVHCAKYTIPSNCQSVKWVHHNTKKHAESTHHSLRGSSSVDQKNTRITHFAFWRFRHFLCLLMRDSDNFLFFRAASGTVTTHTHTNRWEKERVSAVCIIIMNWWYCYALRHCYVTRLLDWLTDWCVQSPTRHSSAKSSYRAKVWQHHNDKASTRTQLSVYARIYWRVAREEWNSQRVSTEQCAVHSDDGFCFVSHGKPSLCMRLWGARIR